MTERDARLRAPDVAEASPSGTTTPPTGTPPSEPDTQNPEPVETDPSAARMEAGSQRATDGKDDSGEGRVNRASSDVAHLIALTAGVLANIQTVVGEGAAQALFRYGGFEEGKRVARASGAGRFDRALQSFDELLGHTSTGTTSDDGGVEIQLTGCDFIEEEHRAVDIVLLGLYEGLLHAVFQARYKGIVLGRQSGGRATLRFDLDPSTA